MAFDYEAKIAALLIKAEAKGTTVHEAEALSEAAERLTIKYGIDRATAEAKKMANGGVRDEKVVSLPLHFTGEYREAYMLMAHAVLMALPNLKDYKSGGNFSQTRKSGVHLYIVGFESDAKSAELFVRSLQLQAVNALNTWIKSGDSWAIAHGTATEKRRARFDFLSSFGGGAASRIRLARQVAEGEAEVAAPGTGLVLRDRGQAVDDFMAGLGLGTACSSRRTSDFSARLAGSAAGRNANTGDTSLGGSRTALSR